MVIVHHDIQGGLTLTLTLTLTVTFIVDSDC